MTRVSCPSCRVRFGAAATAVLTTCPECGRPLEAASSAADTLGFQLFAPADPPPALPVAVEAALPTDVPLPPDLG
jgi:hypothetical protein